MKFMIPKFNLCHLYVYMYINSSSSVYVCAGEDFVVQTCTNIWQSHTQTRQKSTLATIWLHNTQAQTVQTIAAERNWKLYLTHWKTILQRPTFCISIPAALCVLTMAFEQLMHSRANVLFLCVGDSGPPLPYNVSKIDDDGDDDGDDANRHCANRLYACVCERASVRTCGGWCS